MSARFLSPTLLAVILLGCKASDEPADASSTGGSDEGGLAAKALADVIHEGRDLGGELVGIEVEGRLWVFQDGSEELDRALRGEFPEKHVSDVGGGPRGVTVKSPDGRTLLKYTSMREGYVTRVDDDGRLWLFEEGTDEARALLAGSPPEKHATLVGEGPGGCTVKCSSEESFIEYSAARDGFDVAVDPDGRVWVFRSGSDEARAAAAGEFSEKHVSDIGAGPLGRTLKAPDTETLEAYRGA